MNFTPINAVCGFECDTFSDIIWYFYRICRCGKNLLKHVDNVTLLNRIITKAAGIVASRAFEKKRIVKRKE